MESSSRRIRELEAEVRDLRSKIGSSGTSSLELDEAGCSSSLRLASARRKRSIKSSVNNIRTEEITNQILDVVNKNLDERLKALHSCEDKIFGALKEITKVEEGIKNLQKNPPTQSLMKTLEGEMSSVSGADDEEAAKLRKRSKSRKNITILEDVQLVSPLSLAESTENSSFVSGGSGKRKKKNRLLEKDDRTPNRWNAVSGRRGRRTNTGSETRRSAVVPRPSDRSGTPGGPTGGKPNRSGRLPKSAAVVVRSTAENPSYSDILRKAREEVNLEEIGMETVKIREAANRGLVFEVPGPEGGSRADELATRLRLALGGEISVSRPTKMGEFRLYGLNVSITTEEVKRCVVTLSGCRVSEISVGVMRRLPGGQRTTWIRCPATAANKLALAGSIRIGWASVRVDSFRVRPTQCFRCWRFGYVRAKCKSIIPTAPAAVSGADKTITHTKHVISL